MTDICIVADQTTSVIRASDPNDEWDAPDTTTDTSIDGFRIATESDYTDLTIGFTPETGRTYYLLYVVYATGDSFSHHEGRIAYVDLFEDRQLAEDNAATIRTHYEAAIHDKDDEAKVTADKYSVFLKTANGGTWKIFAAWIGYFESLTDVIVEPVSLISR